jgi:HEPN domain-containing protein
MDIQKLLNHWIVGAEKDWLACRHLYKSKDYSQCLFWGHLVLEKILKAHVVKKIQAQPPYSHDLVLLAKKGNVELIKDQRDQLNEINTFNQFGRYDNEIMTFTEKYTPEYAEKYFNIIKELYTWLQKSFQSGK